MFSRRKSDEIRLILPCWHTNKKCGMFFYSGRWLSKYRSWMSKSWPLDVGSSLSKHTSNVVTFSLGLSQGSFVSSNTPPRPPTPHIHESLSGPIWCPGSKHKWQTCRNMPQLCHPKNGMTIEIPCVFLLCVCVALLSPASRMRLTKPSFTNWVRDLAHCRCAKLSPQFFFRHD